MSNEQSRKEILKGIMSEIKEKVEILDTLNEMEDVSYSKSEQEILEIDRLARKVRDYKVQYVLYVADEMFCGKGESIA